MTLTQFTNTYLITNRAKTYGTIRDNINGSVKSFVNLLSMLANICKTNNATLNFICHSEGNYMLTGHA